MSTTLTLPISISPAIPSAVRSLLPDGARSLKCDEIDYPLLSLFNWKLIIGNRERALFTGHFMMSDFAVRAERSGAVLFAHTIVRVHTQFPDRTNDLVRLAHSFIEFYNHLRKLVHETPTLTYRPVFINSERWDVTRTNLGLVRSVTPTVAPIDYPAPPAPVPPQPRREISLDDIFAPLSSTPTTTPTSTSSFPPDAENSARIIGGDVRPGLVTDTSF